MLKYRGEVILFFVTIIAASGWFFSKFALAEFPPIGFMGGRFLLAFLIYLPFAYPQLKKLSLQQIGKACSVGLCYTIYLVFWLFGLLKSQQFGEGAFLVSLSMLIAPLFAWLLFKEPPARIFWYALPLALLGLYLLAIGKGKLHFSLGSLIFLSSSVTAAIYFVLNNKFARNIPALSLATLQVGVVGICCSGYSILFEMHPSHISLTGWGWFTARMFLQTVGQKYCEVSNAAIIMILEPVWTFLLSMWILDESLNWTKGLGCLCILLSFIIYRLPYRNFKLRRG